VVKPGKKARVCVDFARNFNDYMGDQYFSYSSVRAGVELAQQCPTAAYFVKLDISACFLSFPVHPDDTDFFVCKAGGDYYKFLCMAFGLKNAPRAASLLLDVVSSAIADAGVLHVRYLDDFLLPASSFERAWACAHVAAETLQRFGLALSPGKVEGPLQRLEFLGIEIDSVAETLSITAERQAELRGLLDAFYKRRFTSVRKLQSLLGKLQFASQVLPGSRPFMRRLIDTIGSRCNGRLRLGAAFRSDIAYWREHIAQWNGRARWRAPSSEPFVFASDASTKGFAYGLEACPPGTSLPEGFKPGEVRAGLWSGCNGDAARQQHSSNIQWGEFFCTVAAAVEFGPLLADSHVVFVIDNNSDVHVINRLRTREPRVAALLRSLCDVALLHNFSFEAVHRSGELNVLMDWASRPEYHHFSADPADVPIGSRVGGGVGGVTCYPPLLIPSRITYTNSRCLKFDASGSSATWTGSSNGWCKSASTCTSLQAQSGLTATTGASWRPTATTTSDYT
jgi:hypothetical protein